MKDIFYRMQKAVWDHRTGGYTAIGKVTGNMNLKQIQGRVARLPDSTIHNWTITMYRRDEKSEGSERIIGSISAEEFDGDVPVF